MQQLTKKGELVFKLYENLNNVFRNDDDYVTCSLEEAELNEEYFIALLQAFHIHFSTLTKEELDLIEFIGILNKLTFQHLMSNREEEAKTELMEEQHGLD